MKWHNARKEWPNKRITEFIVFIHKDGWNGAGEVREHELVAWDASSDSRVERKDITYWLDVADIPWPRNYFDLHDCACPRTCCAVFGCDHKNCVKIYHDPKCKFYKS